MREEFGFIAIIIKLKRIFKEFFLNRSGRKFCTGLQLLIAFVILIFI
ncbi:unnamed protein product [Larinioides sclopetarius]|uniref:Uncharacterized protein n=1 Tax=Larinioides sclopetarius TaxID=280406 RepID=A0AAV2A0B4_9ARAC